MKKITTLIELKEEILLLEAEHTNNTIALKEEFKLTYYSLKPLNLIKDTLKELTTVPDFKLGLVNSTIGIGAGYVAKKAVIGTTQNPIKKLLGTLLQVGITGIVSKNGDGIKLKAMKFIGHLFSKRKGGTN